jgi:hypothetical protein
MIVGWQIILVENFTWDSSKLGKSIILSHLEIVKDVTKEILRRNLIESRYFCVGVGGNIILFQTRFKPNNIIF